MPNLPIFASRFSLEFTIISGTGNSLENTNGWPCCTVDYGNAGSEDEPPTRTFVNSVFAYNGGGKQHVISLPVSTEFIFIPDIPVGGGDDDNSISGDRVTVKWIKRRRYV